MSSTTSPSSNKATFGARRGKWLDQIDADPECTCAYFRIFWHVGQCLNNKTFTGRPGHPYLAERARVEPKTVQRAMKWAAARGHISQSFHGCKGTVITPLLASERRQPGHKPGHKPGHSLPVTHGDSRGNGSDSQDSQDSHKYKKEREIKIGNPRGPKAAPEKDSKPLSSDSSKPSLQPTCEVPLPTTALPAEFQKWLGGLPRMPKTRFWDQRRPEDAATLERYRRAANGRAIATGVSS